MADLIRSRTTRTVLLVLVTLLVATGCTSSDDEEKAPSAVCGPGTTHACFDLSAYGNLYCTVLQARAGLEDGRLRVGDLPSWADRTPRGEAVRVFDFRDPPTTQQTGAQLTQELLNAMRKRRVLVDADELQERRDCRRDLSQRTVAASEGGWPRTGS